MRYKDVSKPLYEAVRYGNKEKSYVLSNLNKFNFGVELEFDLPKEAYDIKILDPTGVVRECLFLDTIIITDMDDPILQNYSAYSMSDILREVETLLRNIQAIKPRDDKYDLSEIKGDVPEYMQYMVWVIDNILLDLPYIDMYGIFLSLLFPVSPLKGNASIVPNHDIIDEVLSIHNLDLLDVLINKETIYKNDYDGLVDFIKSIKLFVEYVAELPTDPNLEQIKIGLSLKDRHPRVMDFIARKLVEGTPNTEEEPFDIYKCLSPFIVRPFNITYYLKILRRDFTGLVDIIPLVGITINSAKSNPDIQSLSTKFNIVPEGTRQIEFISPTCTGQEITQCFADMKKLTDIVISQKGTTSNRTGLHLSVSYNGDTSNFNALKFLLFSDSYRQIVKPEHVRNYVSSISENLFTLAIYHVITDMVYNGQSLQSTLSSIEVELSKDKYMSVNLGVMNNSNGRVELRWPGGKGYEHRLDEYIDSAFRAMYGLEIAYNPVAFRKEYLLSFFRVLDGIIKQKLNCDLLTLVGFLKHIYNKVPEIQMKWELLDGIIFSNDRAEHSTRDFSNLKSLEKDILDNLQRENP